MDLSPTSHLDDEALSATLDVPAAETANPSEAGAAHVAGCARCTRRREQLAAARASLAAAPVESLDELTRRRLIARALADSAVVGPARRWVRHPALAGGVAAAILALLIAVPFLTREDRSTNRALSSAAGPAQEAATFLGDLGEVSTPEAIRMQLGATTMAASPGGESQAASKAADSSTAGPTTPPAADATELSPTRAGPAPVAPAAPVPSPLNRSSGADAARTREFAPQARAPADQAMTSECTSALAAGPARGARLVATGVGTLRGTPVVVSVFAMPSGEVAYITARDGCGLLQRYPL
jgi:hypothetical protein